MGIANKISLLITALSGILTDRSLQTVDIHSNSFTPILTYFSFFHSSTFQINTRKHTIAVFLLPPIRNALSGSELLTSFEITVAVTVLAHVVLSKAY